MYKRKNLVSIMILVGLASSLYVNFRISNFRFSFAGVLFPVLIYVYRDINSIFLGIYSGVGLYFFRLLAFILSGGGVEEGLVLFFPEASFYILYGIFFFVIKYFLGSISMNQMFFIFLANDFLCNSFEVFIRVGRNIFADNLNILKSLLVVTFIRSGLAILIIIGFKYYRMFLIKEEHEKRYKKLLWLTSRLKTEVYWMEKNMENIEKVMSNCYELFIKILNDEEKESWGNRSLEISKDVHEIKKEYGLVVRGIEEIIVNKSDDSGMYFHELLLILKESMEGEIRYRKKNIEMDFQFNGDFYTEKHYYLMSVFRNIIMNSIDAIEDKGNIIFTHEIDNNVHIFKIKDTGCGISENELSNIFSPGYSTKIDYSTGEVNRGLGLSLVKDIVEIHLSGNIYVTSTKGRGTIFKLSIPKSELEE